MLVFELKLRFLVLVCVVSVWRLGEIYSCRGLDLRGYSFRVYMILVG